MTTKKPSRKRLATGLAVLVIGALGAGPAASAYAAPTNPAPNPLSITTGFGANSLPGLADTGGCGLAAGNNNDQAPTGGTFTSACQGGGLIFVGPSVGQIATVIGPTIMSPGFAGQVAVSAGNAANDILP